MGIQIILLRQFMTILYGNELVFGIVLSLWLLWMGAGSFVGGGWWKRNAPKSSMFPTALAFSLLVAIAIYGATKFVRHLMNVPFGEHLTYSQVFVFAACLLCLPAFLYGFLFSLLARSSKDFVSKNEPAAFIYAFEAAGTVFVGIIFTFMLMKFSNLVCLFALALFITLLLYLVCRLKRLLLSFFVSVFLLLPSIPRTIETYLLQHYWTSVDETISLRDWQFSRFGQSSILAWGGEKYLYHNGIKVSALTSSIENQIHAATLVCQHKSPKKILLIEGNASGLALSCADFVHVDVMEMDGETFRFARAHMDSFAQQKWNQKNKSIKIADARRALKRSESLWDMIILNVGAPTTALSNRFYTQSFFALAKERLATNGILAICSFPSAENFLGDELLSLNRIIRNTLKSEFQHVLVLPGDEAIYFAAESPETLTSSVPLLQQRFAEYGISLEHFVPQMFHYIYSQQRIDDLAEQLDASTDVRLNSDFRPISYLYDFLIWHKIFYGHNRIIQFLFSQKYARLILSVFVLLLFLLLIPLFSKSRHAAGLRILFSAAIIGFMGMTLSMVLLVAFQTLFGYIYAWIGVAMAGYMAGMSAATGIVNKRIEKLKTRKQLIWIFCCAILVQLCLVPIFMLIDSLNSAVLYLLLFILSGALVGAAFPLLCRLYSRATGKAEFGRIYAADVLGGAVAALFTAAILIPVYGFFYSLLFTALLCLMGVVVLLRFKDKALG